MFYILTKQFSSSITLSCTIALTFMAYHISISQDGRSYSLLMLLGMAGLFFLVRYLTTNRKKSLFFASFFYAISILISYSAIPFVFFSQILFFYRWSGEKKIRLLPSFLILNGLTLLFCSPWGFYLIVHYNDQPLMDPFHTEGVGSFFHLFYRIFHDWAPHLPLMILSLVLLISFPLIARNRKNAFVLLGLFFFPVTGLYLFCVFFDIKHFVSSRYFISFFPLFLIIQFLSVAEIESKLRSLKNYLRPRLILLILFIASNMVILPFYYKSEKQDFRSLANYLKNHLRPGDNIFYGHGVYIPGILHYLGIYPSHKDRHYRVSFSKMDGGDMEYFITFIYKNNQHTIFYSKHCCLRYILPGGRLWIAVPKNSASTLTQEPPFVFKGFFDGSFLNFTQFPFDASIYLFLWDPSSPNEKGIDFPFE